MNPSFAYFLRRVLGAAALALVPWLALAQTAADDPPGRIAYISAHEGSVQLSYGRGGWAPAALNWPVTGGTRVQLEPGARVELHGGWTALRAQGPTRFDVTRLDDASMQIALTEGSLALSVRELRAGERVEINTPQLALVADQPGDYRLDVDPRSDTSRVSVLSGAATVYGESGQAAGVRGGEQVLFAGRALGVAERQGFSVRDGFGQWVAARDALDEQSRAARYVSRDMPGYQQLDGYGEWAQDPALGNVWYPNVSSTEWAPYRYGQWTWVEPWGWTWVDDAPWGFAPSHYGRWTQIGARWAWVPGPVAPRPVYAPALVAFVGGSGWSASLGGGLPGAAWFPLAPGEYWDPYYRASPNYRRRINTWGPGREFMRPPRDHYHFQGRPHAVTVAPPEPGRRPRFGDASRLPPDAFGQGRIVPPQPRGPGGAPPHGLNPPAPRPGMAPVFPRERPTPTPGAGLPVPAPASPGMAPVFPRERPMPPPGAPWPSPPPAMPGAGLRERPMPAPGANLPTPQPGMPGAVMRERPMPSAAPAPAAPREMPMARPAPQPAFQPAMPPPQQIQPQIQPQVQPQMPLRPPMQPQQMQPQPPQQRGMIGRPPVAGSDNLRP